MTDTQPFVTVIVPVKDDPERLDLCLTALDGQDYPAHLREVLVVDNGSVSDLLPVVAGHVARLLREPSPGSYRARNRALKLARGDVLAFTDADCLPRSSWLSTAVAALTGGVDIVAGRVELFARDPARLTPAEAYEVVKAFPQERYVSRSGWCATANMVVWRRCFDRVGLFRDDLRSGGDAEWGQRATAAGLQIQYRPEVVVRHPARHALSDLYAKLWRVHEGDRSQRQLRGEPLRPWHAELRRGARPPLGSLARARALSSTRNRVAYVIGEFFVRYGALAVRVRQARATESGGTRGSRS